MTLDEFFIELSKTPRDWRHTGFGIRRQAGAENCCPITACDPDGPTMCDSWDETAVTLGLSREDARRIIAAADDRAGHDPAIRDQLLAACGLTTEPQPQPHTQTQTVKPSSDPAPPYSTT